MNLSITSTIIRSPLNASHFLCTELRAVGMDGVTMRIERLEDRNDLPRLTNTKPDERGEWLAVFTREGDLGETQLDAFYLGGELVENDEGEDRYCADTRALEGLSEADAVRKLINMAFDELIKPMIQAAYACVVLRDKLDLAHWMMASGLVHLLNNSDYKVTRVSWGNVTVDRIYKVSFQNLAVKQTLVTSQTGVGLRQTQLHQTKDHKFMTFDEVCESARTLGNSLVPNPYAYKEILNHYEGVEIKHPAVLAHVTQFDRAGFSKEFILMYIKETERLAKEAPKPMMHGLNPQMYPAGSSPITPMQFGNPGIPTGHPATDAANGMPHTNPQMRQQQMHFHATHNNGLPTDMNGFPVMGLNDPYTGRHF